MKWQSEWARPGTGINWGRSHFIHSLNCQSSYLFILSILKYFQIKYILLLRGVFFNGVRFLLNRDVSDHHKASLDPIIFFKDQCALIDHKIFMKWIWSIVFLEDIFGFLWLFGVFHVFKRLFLFYFHQEKISCNADI